MVREGLTEKVEADRVVKFKFENVGKLPPPVLQVRLARRWAVGCTLVPATAAPQPREHGQCGKAVCFPGGCG